MESTPDPPKRRNSDKFPPAIVVTEETLKLGKEVRRWLNILTALTVVLYLCMAGWVAWGWLQAQTNTKALCAVHDAAQRRVDAGVKFLIQNPNGAIGISRKDIETSINRDRAVVTSLDILNCPPITS